MKHLRAILLLPVMVTIVIPGVLLALTRSARPRPVLAVPGLVLIGGGLTLMVATIRLFARVGQGTLAPWDETQELVIVGPYRYVRNPMISGVIGVLLGESLVSGSPWVLGWALLFTAGNLIYMPLSEEPGLEARFGESYREYRENVPAWLPRLKPWE